MAIAFDNAAVGGLTVGLSHTFAYTVGSGSDRLILVWSLIGTSDALTGVTYDGAALTQVAKVQEPSGRWNYLHFGYAPTSGSHNVVSTASSTDIVLCAASSYDGVNQTGQPDSSNTGTASTTASFSVSTTTVADNCWLMGIIRTESGTPDPASGSTFRASSGAGSYGMGDTNMTITPPGSSSYGATFTVPNNWMGIVGSFAPTGGGGATTWPGYQSPFGWR